jgi:hypothetical protein
MRTRTTNGNPPHGKTHTHTPTHEGTTSSLFVSLNVKYFARCTATGRSVALSIYTEGPIGQYHIADLPMIASRYLAIVINDDLASRTPRLSERCLVLEAKTPVLPIPDSSVRTDSRDLALIHVHPTTSPVH